MSGIKSRKEMTMEELSGVIKAMKRMKKEKEYTPKAYMIDKLITEYEMEMKER